MGVEVDKRAGHCSGDALASFSSTWKDKLLLSETISSFQPAYLGAQYPSCTPFFLDPGEQWTQAHRFFPLRTRFDNDHLNMDQLWRICFTSTRIHAVEIAHFTGTVPELYVISHLVQPFDVDCGYNVLGSLVEVISGA